MMYHKAFSVVNEGLSIKYGEEEGHCFAILVSAGKETSLLNPKDDNLNYYIELIHSNFLEFFFLE